MSVERLIRKIDSFRKRKLAGFKAGLLKAGLELQADSQQLVPVETGELKRSARTELTVNNDLRPQVSVIYDADHATLVHENLDAAHGADYNTKHADAIAAGRDFARGENQQAKFLEDPLRKNNRKYQQIIARETKNR